MRARRTDLMRHGALARVGRELVVIGDRYTRFIEQSTAKVPGWEIAPNRNGEQATAA